MNPTSPSPIDGEFPSSPRRLESPLASPEPVQVQLDVSPAPEPVSPFDPHRLPLDAPRRHRVEPHAPLPIRSGEAHSTAGAVNSTPMTDPAESPGSSSSAPQAGAGDSAPEAGAGPPSSSAEILRARTNLTDTQIHRLSPQELRRELDALGTLSDADDLRQEPEAVVRDLGAPSMSPRHQFEAWIGAMVKAGASDLILRAGGRPSTRVDGRISFLPGRVPGAGALIEVLEGVIGPKRMEEWRETGSVDAALYLDGLGRFRLNAYKQMGEPALVLRHVAENPPDLSALELPTASLQQIARRKRGFVLVTGVAGSGKSTTLAGLIEHMNRSLERHIVTLEDPVEMLFREKRCVISQREVSVDCRTFHEGLRHALRQSPDVILIGEMRDSETVTAALDAAETGHLVMSTMHTVNAPQTVDRILSFFRAEQHAQVRMRLADNLAAVLSQRLVLRSEGKGLVPACELMISTPRIRELLAEGDTAEIGRVVEAAGERGLISFNQSLKRLVQAKLVDLKDALAASDKPEELVLALRGITKGNDRSQNMRPAAPGPQRPAGPSSQTGGSLRMTGD